MYPPSPYFESRGSYQSQVTPPTSQPDASPTQAICINQDWLPFIAGALKQLSLQATWKVPDDNALLDVQGRVFNLIALFEKGAAGCGQLLPPQKLCMSGSFADERYAYVPQTGFGCTPTWVAGSGWHSCTDPVTGQQQLHIERDFTGLTTVNSYEFDIDQGIGGGSYDITAIWSAGGATVRTDTVHIVTGSGSVVVTANFDADHVILEAVTVAASTFTLTANGWKMCYTGLFPLGEVPPATVWTHTFDFTISSGGFFIVPNPTFPNTGQYTAGVGWQSQQNTVGGQFQDVLIIDHAFTQRTILSVEIHWGAPIAANGGFRAVKLDLGGFDVNVLNLNSGAGTFVETFSMVQASDAIFVVPTNNNTGPGTHTITVTKLIVSGLGVDPF